MFFVIPLLKLKKQKSWPKMRPGGALHATALDQVSHFGGFGPLEVRAREASFLLASWKVGKLASWK